MSQLDLFEWLRPAEAEQATPAGVDGALRRALTRAMRDSQSTRAELAAQLSAEFGTKVTKAQLDSWTAESKSTHRIPAAYLPALCRLTGSHAPLAVLARQIGLTLSTPKDRLLAARGALAEQRATLARQERVLRAMLEARDD